DLRSDRAKRLWQRYHNHLYAAVVLLVAGVAGYEFWHYRQAEARAAEGARFHAALMQAENGDTAGAGQALEALARDAGGGYAVVARLYDADLLSKKGDVDGALQRYDAIAADGGVDQLFRDLATVLGAGLRVDRDDPASVIQRLQPLTGEASTWRFSARELTAV